MKFTVAAALLAAPAAAFTPVAGRTQMKMGMEKQIASAALAGAMMFGAGSSAFAASIGEGENVFNANCAACHAGGQNVIQNEKTLQQDALKQYLDGGMKESSVVYQVTNGKNAMPAFGGRLSDDDIANVAAYVIDQATGDKW